MPLVRSASKPTDIVYDSFGNVLRADWEPVSYNGQSLWHTPGETHTGGENVYNPGDAALMSGYQGPEVTQDIRSALASGIRSHAVGAPGQASVNAYNASLASQGISPSELPYGQGGQIATARVLAKHRKPLPDYLKGYFAGDSQGLLDALSEQARQAGITPLELARQLGYV